MVAAVKKIAGQTEETKYVAETLRDGNLAINFNSTINGSSDWYRAIPLVANGTGSQQRVGDKLRPVKCKLHFNLRFTPDDDLTRDIYATVYVLNSKANKFYANEGANPTNWVGLTEFLDAGDGTKTIYPGTWLGSTFPINKEMFSLVKKKTVHLNKPSGGSDAAGVIGQFDGNGKGMYSVGHLHSSFTVDITCPTLFRYQDSVDKIPNNFAPVWAIGYYYSDGTLPDTTTGLLSADVRTEMYYKDA